MYKIMTPGPTRVRENVALARSMATTNPDIDIEFFKFYKECCEKLSKLMNTENPAYILGGEGILGLEAACASLTEQGDRVLVIENGVFGKGFADFVNIYGGEPVIFSSNTKEAVSIEDLERFLEVDSDFKYATIVHCDTPSGVLNDINAICNLLAKFGIMSVVDSVAGMFGEYVNIEESNIDILCGGSQKALSAPPGLTMVWISPKAFSSMENRKSPIASYYANLLNMRDYYANQWFPYTMPISDIMGLAVAIDNVMADKEIIKRHEIIGRATRAAVVEAGLELYLDGGFANTVTVVNVPTNTRDIEILETMKRDYNILISGSFDYMSGKVIRIGHMGENARCEHVSEVLFALDESLKKLGVELKTSMGRVFLKEHTRLSHD